MKKFDEDILPLFNEVNQFIKEGKPKNAAESIEVILIRIHGNKVRELNIIHLLYNIMTNFPEGFTDPRALQHIIIQLSEAIKNGKAINTLNLLN